MLPTTLPAPPLVVSPQEMQEMIKGLTAGACRCRGGAAVMFLQSAPRRRQVHSSIVCMEPHMCEHAVQRQR